MAKKIKEIKVKKKKQQIKKNESHKRFSQMHVSQDNSIACSLTIPINN